MNIVILSVGKIKETFWNDAIAEYIKRIQAFGTVHFETIDNKPFFSNDPNSIKKEEAALILERIKKMQGTIIALDEHEKEFDSVQFSKFLEEKSMYGDTLIFVIGGPKGLHEDVLEAANFKISLSKMTFPHNLVKVVLVEQLYRAMTISAGKDYHY